MTWARGQTCGEGGAGYEKGGEDGCIHDEGSATVKVESLIGLKFE